MHVILLNTSDIKEQKAFVRGQDLAKQFMNSGHSKALYSELKIDSKLTWCQRQLFRETKISCKTQNSFFVNCNG